METLHQTHTTNQEQFFGHICEHIDKGAVTIMLSIGHRLGLFDFMSDLPPSSSMRMLTLRTFPGITANHRIRFHQ